MPRLSIIELRKGAKKMNFNLQKLEKLLNSATPCKKCENSEIKKDEGNRPYFFSPTTKTEDEQNSYLSLWTGTNMQAASLCLRVGKEQIYTPHGSDIFLESVYGTPEISIEKDPGSPLISKSLARGEAVIIPSGLILRIKNNSTRKIKLFMISAKPLHRHSTVIP